jgi:lipoprotein-releasing system ATP-binding protein
MIVVENLTKEFEARSGVLRVLEGVNLSVERGESVAVMGPSGSGKSTLLHILGTLDTPTSGRVELAGTDPFSLSPDAIARLRNRQIGFVFQDHQLLPQCSALENVLIPTLVGEADKAESAARALGLLERVGLAQRVDYRPAELSGGERQRVAIARALIRAPGILLCDEPTGNLDQETAESVGDCFVELQREEKVALVVVTHNPIFARRFSRTLVLEKGRLVVERR